MTSSTSDQFCGFIAPDDGNDRVVVVCSGEIDMASAAAFRALLDEAVKAAPNVVVDMHGVTFLDSCGLRVLAITRSRAAGNVTIRNAPPLVTRLLQLSAMDRFFNTTPAGVSAPCSHVVR